MSITEIAIKRPLLITVIFTVLLLFGYISYKSLNYNLLPKFEANVVTVITTYRGASAGEVETNVTKKIEDAVSSLEGLDKVNSTSQEGASIVTIQLKSGVDADKAQRDAQRKVDQITSQLPDDVDRPKVNKISTDDAPVLRMGVTSGLSDAQLYDLIDKQIKPQIENVNGVGQVNIIGGNEREIQVNLDKNKLEAYHLSVSQVAQAINAANQSYPAGQVKTISNQYSIRYDAKVSDVSQLAQFIIKRNADGSRIYLKDVADIVYGSAESTALNHINARPSVGIQVVKQSDANAVSVCQLVKNKLGVIEKQYKDQGVKFEIASDQSIYTLASANAVVDDLFLAVLIVAFVMLMFLHSVRSSLFILVSLPSSMIPTFIAMYVLGFSLNLMTLMALSLVVGILVDDSIVVLENIFRHMEMGKDKRSAALEGRNEIGFTALAITLVDVVVFVPLALAGGLIGNILKEFSLVVVFSTLMSLFVSFTVTPLLASRFGKLEVLSKKSLWGRLNRGFEKFLDTLKEEYGRILRWVLGKKRWLFLSVIVLLVSSVMLVRFGFIGATFIQQGDRGELSVKLELAPSASLYQTNQVVQAAEKILLSQPEVVKVFSNIGYSSSGFAGSSSSNSNLADLNVTLVDKSKRAISADDFGMKMRNEISKIPGVKVKVAAIGITGNVNDAPVQIAIKGTDMDQIRKTAAMVKEIVENVPGTQFVEYSVKDPKPEIEINLDREKMAVLGLDAAQVGVALQNAYRGNDQSKFKFNGNEYDILIGLDRMDKTSLDDVKQLNFVNAGGEVFALSQFANVRETTGESVLERMDRLSSIKVNATVFGRPTGTVGDDIKKVLATKTIPEGVSIKFVGDLERQADAFGSLGLALMLAIVLIYLIMVALYESVVYPFVVLFSIPVALIGALLALALSMQSLSIFTIVGFIMLLGLVSKNAILIVDFANKLKAEGLSVKQALVEAGKERLRPILMTTIAMIVGMLPIALASSAGAEVKNGMAWAIIGGLTSSMILTLLVVPSVYLVIDNMLARLAKLKRLFSVRKERRNELEAA